MRKLWLYWRTSWDLKTQLAQAADRETTLVGEKSKPEHAFARTGKDEVVDAAESRQGRKRGVSLGILGLSGESTNHFILAPRLIRMTHLVGIELAS